MAHYYRGDVLCDLGRRVEAEFSYLEAIALDEKFAAAWDRLGVNRVVQRRFEEAVEAFDRALQLADDDFRTWHNRGIAAWLSDELELLRRVAEKGSRPDPAGIRATLKRWQQADDLAAFREPAALKTLPRSERTAWAALWGEVSGLVRSIQ